MKIECDPQSLAQRVEANGWNADALSQLFGIEYDRRRSNTLRALIEQAIEEGDNPEWIQERVSQPRHCQHTLHEDCLICCECGRCSESLDENDVCAECRKDQGATSMSKLQVIVEVEGGCVTEVEVLDAQGNALEFELTIKDHDEPGDEEDKEAD